MTVVDRVQPSAQLRETGVMAILRAASAERFPEVCARLVDAGVTCMEITLTTPGALEAIRAVREQLPDAVDVGAGTVTSAADVHAAVEAGAGFVVSPSTELDVLAAAAEAGVASYPGAFTATEVLAAWRGGATAVKLFPAGVLGPGYAKDLRGPFPNIPLLPTGRVGVDDIGDWIRAGVIAVGLGGPLFGDALSVDASSADAASGDLDALSERARRALAEVANARGTAA